MFHILIDGYNLVHATRGTDRDWTALSLEDGRKALVDFLVVHRRPAREKITVVFDGASGTGQPRTARVQGVDIIFSDLGVTADQVIRDLVLQSPNPRGYLVITGDREIRTPVLAVGAKAVSPRSFLDRAEEDHEKRRKAIPPEPREKYEGPGPGQTQEWRRILGFDDEEDK